MNTRQDSQLIHLNQQYLSRLTIVFLVLFSSFVVGLLPFVFGLTATDVQDNLIIPSEAELWQPVGEAF